MENFLRGHVGAFGAWGGLPRVLLYDNLKSAVLAKKNIYLNQLVACRKNIKWHYRPVMS